MWVHLVCFWTICFKNCSSPPIWKKSPQVDTPSNFYCLHQRWIPHQITIFMLKTRKNLHFLLQSLLLYFFHFTHVLFAYIGHANFDFNQCSIFTDCCFQHWKRFEWSLLLRFSSTHKTIPFSLSKFSIPPLRLTVMLFEKP